MTKSYTLTLTPEQINIVGGALGEMPFRVASPVVQAINEQLAAADAKAAAELDEQRNRNRDESTALPPVA